MISDRGAQALSKLHSTVSVYDQPELWLKENSDQLKAAFADVSCLRSADIAGLLYPRTMIYVHNLLGASANRSALAIEDRWAPVNQISQLSHYQDIQNSIRDYLRCFDYHPRTVRENWEGIQHLDNLSILARAIVVLKDHQGVKDFVQEQGPSVDPFLNLLQELLDAHYVGHARPLILRSLLDLSKHHSVYPKSLILQGVTGKSSMAIASGSFGYIYQGTYQNKAVAVKAMRNIGAKDPKKLVKAFIREAVLWRQLKHPNVLQFYGVYQWPTEQGHTICLVSPWMKHKNMVEYLGLNPDTDRPSLMLDIAQGLQYLHEFQDPAVIHGDLKGSNILITDDCKACLSDFGLCTLIEDAALNFTPTSSTTFTGALKYLAPELLRSEADNSDGPGGSDQARKIRRTTASDIYAFGCVCYEEFQMLTGHPRFSDLGPSDTIIAALQNHDIAKPEICIDELWVLIKSCWEVESSSRPRIGDIVQDWKANLSDPKRFNLPTHLPSSPLHQDTCSSTPSFVDKSSINVHDEDFYSQERSSLRREMELGFSSRGENGARVSSIPERMSSITLTTIDLARSRANKPRILPGDQTKELKNEDIIIALLGPAGTGKSSFINTMMCQQVALVGDDLESCTQEVAAFGCIHPDGSGRRVIIVDTPGFDDTYRLDFDILKDIAQWLEKTYRRRITLSGILHFHSIAESRMRATPLRNLGMFQVLCGENALGNVVLTTTNWDRVSLETGSRREAELIPKFWRPLIDHGSRVARFQTRTYEAAWDLIDLFNSPWSTVDGDLQSRPALQIQTELVNEEKTLHQTSAHLFLIGWWTKLTGKLKRAVGTKSDKFKSAKKQKMRLESSPISTRSLLGQRSMLE